MLITSNFEFIQQVSGIYCVNIFLATKKKLPFITVSIFLFTVNWLPGMEIFSGHFLPKELWKSVKGTTGEQLLVAKPLNKEKLLNDLKNLREKGIESIAVVLMHSYT